MVRLKPTCYNEVNTPMKLPALKIHYKIVIPFTLLFVAATVIIAFTSISLISDGLEERVQKQIERASEMVLQTNFALNPPILDRFKFIVDADIVTYSRAGEVVATTVDLDTHSELIKLIQSLNLTNQIFEEGKQLVITDITYQGAPYKVERVIGSRSRVTMGGFLALDKRRTRLRYWS